MSKFTVEVNGIPFTVNGVSTEEQAVQKVREAAEVDPLLYQNKALSLGYEFDFNTKQGRERGELSKFLIGAGKTFDDAIDFVHEAFLEQTGTDLAELQRFDSVQQQEEAAFANLQENNQFTVGAGQFAPEIVAGLGGGAVAVRGAFNLARSISPFSWFRRAGKKALKEFTDEGLSPETLAAAGRTKKGQKLITSLNKVKNPSKKVLNQFARSMKNAADEAAEGGAKVASRAQQPTANVLRPAGRNKAVQKAQARAQKELDEGLASTRSGTNTRQAPRSGGRADPLEGPAPVLQGSDDIVQEVLRAARTRSSLTRQDDLPL